MAETYRRKLYEVALDQYGFVTADDARDLGIPVVELGKLAHRGKLERVAYGVYRFPEIPVSPRDAYMEAVLWARRGAALSHDAVLALHDLASANPRTLRVVTPHRVRRTKTRDDVTIIRASVPAGELTAYFGIPSTTVARALVDCRALIMTRRLLEAANTARRQGLLLAGEYVEVTQKLRGVP